MGTTPTSSRRVGLAPFTTGTLTENPTNYPNTTPHTTLLATFSPLTAGSFTVYILDGNTDGVYVGNSSVGLGVNGGAAITSASHVLSGTNEFTAYTVTNAATTDVFQVYATTSTNAYPTIGALTFSTAVAALASSSTTLTATPTTQTVGGSVSLSVAVAGLTQTTPAATGTVTLTNTSVTPNVTVGTISLGAAGTGSLRTTALPQGTNVIVASYSGDAVYAASASAPQTVVITGSTALALTAVSPNSGAIGSPATTVTLTGANFAATDVVLYNATVLPSAFVNATTITAVIPASVFTSAGTGMITVRDTQTEATSSAVTFTVSTAPQIVFTGPPSAVSGQQPTLQFQLVNPYPVALTGSLTLTFVSSDSSGINDPAVQFASGGRTISFSIPADSTATPGVQLQTGTVAGTATVSLAVDANGVNVTPANVAPVTITIPRGCADDYFQLHDTDGRHGDGVRCRLLEHA